MARVIKTTLSIEGGGASLLLRGTTDDAVYMGFYARSAAPATRSGFLGYGAVGTNHLTLQNEISDGNIYLTTSGSVSSINLTATLGGYGYVNVAPNLKITNPYGAPYLMLNAASTGSENEAVIALQRRGSKRWEIRKTNQAETGSNVGSNLEITRFNDVGNEIDPVIAFYRDTGDIDVFPTGGGTLGVYGDLLIGYGSDIYAADGPGVHNLGGVLIDNSMEYVSIEHPLYISSGANVFGGLDVETGVLSVQGVPVALNSHTHSYLPLSGGTLTGGVKAPAYILEGTGYGGVVECHGGHRGASTNTDYIILTAPPGWESSNYAVFADITVGLGWAGHVTYRVAATMSTSEAYGWSSSASFRKYHVDMAYAQYQAATELQFGEDGSGQPCIIIGPGSHVYASVHAVIRTGYFDPPNLNPWAVSFAADLTGYTTVAGSLAERELHQSALSVHSTLTVVNDTTSANIQLDAADPSADRDALYGTFRRGVVRWQFGKSATAETGSNAGSDFQVYRYSDAGAYLDAPLTVQRSTGDVELNHNLFVTKQVTAQRAILADNNTVDEAAVSMHSGDTSGGFGGKFQTLFSWNGNPTQYRHGIGTRHSSLSGLTDSGNAIDFYLWNNTTTTESLPTATERVFTIENDNVRAFRSLQVTNPYSEATLEVSSAAGNSHLIINAANTSEEDYASIIFRRRGAARWGFGKDHDTETGANIGSDLLLWRYDDAGAYLDRPLTVRRPTGDVVMPNTVWLNTAETFGVRYNDTESSIDFLVA